MVTVSLTTVKVFRVIAALMYHKWSSIVRSGVILGIRTGFICWAELALVLKWLNFCWSSRFLIFCFFLVVVFPFHHHHFSTLYDIIIRCHFLPGLGLCSVFFFLSSCFLLLLLFRIHQMKKELGIKDDEIKQLKSRYRKIKMINNRECS